LRFADDLLPDDLPMLSESKKLIRQRHTLFVERGEEALPDIRKINARLRELLKASETDFPLSSVQAAELRARLREHVLKISAAEKEAVDLLQGAVV
jgi:hypothetical protein